MRLRNILLGGMSLFLLIGTALGQGQALRIVGSSTVYPFTTTVAERWSKETGNPTPIVESTGTGGGFKLFCGVKDANSPQLTNASRKIKAEELKNCQTNGIHVIESKIGYDAIVLAHAKGQEVKLTKEQIFYALARKIPMPGDYTTTIDNPYKKWSDIDPSLPNEKIEVLGPPPTSGTRDSFLELVMQEGLKEIAKKENFDLKMIDPKVVETLWKSIREDGAYVEAGENDNLIVEKLEANPSAMGIFGYSYLEENQNKIEGVLIDGASPDYDSITSGKYKVSRPLFVYSDGSKEAMDFVTYFHQEKVIGEDGYLAEKSLIPLTKEEMTPIAEEIFEVK